MDKLLNYLKAAAVVLLFLFRPPSYGENVQLHQSKYFTLEFPKGKEQAAAFIGGLDSRARWHGVQRGRFGAGQAV